MSSYAIDPSAWTFANNGAGHGLWGTTSTLGTPTLATPGGSGALATGVSAAATPSYSLTGVNTTAQTTPTTSGTYNSVAPTSITAPTYATSSQQLNSAAATAAASPAATSTAAIAPAVSKLAATTKSKLGIAVLNQNGSATNSSFNTTGATANTGTLNAPSTNSVGTSYAPAATLVPLTTSTNGITSWAAWDPTKNQYVPLSAADNANVAVNYSGDATKDPNLLYGVNQATYTLNGQTYTGYASGGPTGGMSAYGLNGLTALNQQQQQYVTLAQQNAASQAAGYNAAKTAIANTTVTAAPTVQGTNYDFSTAFNQTPTLNAATATAQQAQNTLASQLSTNNYQSGNIAAGARYGAAEAVDSAGKNQLALQTAAATDTNNNLTQFGNALSAQSSAASAYTGAQAQADISNIQDDVTALTSQLNTLNSSTQANVATQLNALQDQINKYNEAVQQAGADSSLAKKIFSGILAAGAIVAAVATGGATTGAAVAATANAANTIAS